MESECVLCANEEPKRTDLNASKLEYKIMKLKNMRPPYISMFAGRRVIVSTDWGREPGAEYSDMAGCVRCMNLWGIRQVSLIRTSAACRASVPAGVTSCRGRMVVRIRVYTLVEFPLPADHPSSLNQITPTPGYAVGTKESPSPGTPTLQLLRATRRPITRFLPRRGAHSRTVC